MLSDKVILSLASSSPRRRDLIALGGWMFHLLPVSVDETPHAGEPAARYVERLAAQKARAAAAEPRQGLIVVAADTTVVDGDEILGKPIDAAEAEALLLRLRNRSHQVYTAISVYQPETGSLVTDVCVTEVPMRDYTAEEIRAYIATGDPFDKAGGYAVQHRGFHPVEGLAGCLANVVGLPLCHLTRTLHQLGIAPHNDVPQACMQALAYDCPVYRQVLAGTL